MIVYRLTKEKYKNDLSGKGAAFRGGRWNSQGTEILYCAANRALAMAEVAVHATVQTVPKGYWMLSMQLPKRPTKINIKNLHQDWNHFPHLNFTKTIGDQLITQNKRLSLLVPSAVVEGEWNVLTNPFHTSFKKVKIVDAVPFNFDRRLF